MLFASCVTVTGIFTPNFCSMFGFGILYDFQGIYHPNMVKTSQISKDHSSYPERPPLQHRTKELAQAMKKQLQHPISKCTLVLLPPGWSWAYRYATFFTDALMLKLLNQCWRCCPSLSLGSNQAGPPSIRPILLCLDRISRTLYMKCQENVVLIELKIFYRYNM